MAGRPHRHPGPLTPASRARPAGSPAAPRRRRRPRAACSPSGVVLRDTHPRHGSGPPRQLGHDPTLGTSCGPAPGCTQPNAPPRRLLEQTAPATGAGALRRDIHEETSISGQGSRLGRGRRGALPRRARPRSPTPSQAATGIVRRGRSRSPTSSPISAVHGLTVTSGTTPSTVRRHRDRRPQGRHRARRRHGDDAADLARDRPQSAASGRACPAPRSTPPTAA